MQRNQFVTGLTLPFIYLLLHLGLHTITPFHSMLNFSEGGYTINSTGISAEYLNDVVAYHNELPAFKSRPLLTQLSLALGGPSNAGVAWLTLSYLGYLACFYILLFGFRRKGKLNWAGFLAMGLCFPVLFAFFPPIYSYEDSWQWFFLLLGIWAYSTERHWISLSAVLLASLIRETSLVFLGARVLAQFWKGFSIKSLRIELLAIFGICTIYLGFQWVLNIESAENQSGWAYRINHLNLNFFDFDRSRESLLTLITVLGIPALLVWKMKLKHGKEFITLVVINSLLVLCFAKAREARLFVLPLIWFFCSIQVEHFRLRYWNSKKVLVPLIVFIGLTLIFFLNFDGLYVQTIGENRKSPFKYYLPVYFSGFFVLIGITIHKYIKERDLKTPTQQLD